MATEPAPRRRPFPAILVLLALAYLPLFAVLSQANYNPLVNDHRPYARTTGGLWPGALLGQLNPFDAGGWLYRPLPEALEWGLSEIFRGWPGGWHCVVLGFRVLMVALVWRLSGYLSTSAATRAAVTSFAALFPSFPESQLIYAEMQIVPVVAAVLLGLARLCPMDEPPRALVAMTATAFVLLTLCKEILAPLSAVLFLGLLLALRPWRRRAGLRLASGVMGLALLLQGLRCLRAVAAPYARQAEIVERGAAVQKNLEWFLDRTFLWTTNLPLTSVVLAGLVALASLVAVMAVYLASPYRALRYVYPAAVLLVPVLALGLDVLGARWPKARTGVAVFLVTVLFALNAPVLWSQAVANRTSTDSDWALLEYLARRRAKGADLALSQRLGRFLGSFEPMARRLNPRYTYPQDAGSTRFPGHCWRVRVRRAPSAS